MSAPVPCRACGRADEGSTARPAPLFFLDKNNHWSYIIGMEGKDLKNWRKEWGITQHFIQNGKKDGSSLRQAEAFDHAVLVLRGKILGSLNEFAPLFKYKFLQELIVGFYDIQHPAFSSTNRSSAMMTLLYRNHFLIV
jgi:hypothetical protein